MGKNINWLYKLKEYKNPKHTQWFSYVKNINRFGRETILQRAEMLQNSCRHEYKAVREGSGWFWVYFEGEGERQIYINNMKCIHCNKYSFMPEMRV